MYPHKKPKVGLFGGSFNPPHKVHITLANYAIKKLKLDLLIFIPTYKSVEKQDLFYLDAQDRKNMLEISRPKLKTIISDFEIQQRKPVQSIETIKHFRNLFNNVELFFLIGSDHLPTLHTWDQLEHIFELINLVVFRRFEKIPEIYFPQELFMKLHLLNNKIYSHSSSIFRENFDYRLLHRNVVKYIKEKKLFI